MTRRTVRDRCRDRPARSGAAADRPDVVRYSGIDRFHPIHYSDRIAKAIGLPGVVVQASERVPRCASSPTVVGDRLGVRQSTSSGSSTRCRCPTTMRAHGAGAGHVTGVSEEWRRSPLRQTHGTRRCWGGPRRPCSSTEELMSDNSTVPDDIDPMRWILLAGTVCPVRCHPRVTTDSGRYGGPLGRPYDVSYRWAGLRLVRPSTPTRSSTRSARPKPSWEPLWCCRVDRMC
jgi:hypothetical protein